MADARLETRLRGLVDRYGWRSELTSSFTTRRKLAETPGTLIVNVENTLEIVDASGAIHRLQAGEGFIAGRGAINVTVTIDQRHDAR